MGNDGSASKVSPVPWWQWWKQSRLLLVLLLRSNDTFLFTAGRRGLADLTAPIIIPSVYFPLLSLSLAVAVVTLSPPPFTFKNEITQRECTALKTSCDGWYAKVASCCWDVVQATFNRQLLLARTVWKLCCKHYSAAVIFPFRLIRLSFENGLCSKHHIGNACYQGLYLKLAKATCSVLQKGI